jgi:hypothetical protein
MKFHTSGAAGLKSGQFNRKRNSKNIEYRINEYRMSKKGILSILLIKKTERSDTILKNKEILALCYKSVSPIKPLNISGSS